MLKFPTDLIHYSECEHIISDSIKWKDLGKHEKGELQAELAAAKVMSELLQDDHQATECSIK